MIVTIQNKSRIIDKNKEFRHYKHAILEHEPILLSNGMWLHIYKVTEYDNLKNGFLDDIDEEEESRL